MSTPASPDIKCVTMPVSPDKLITIPASPVANPSNPVVNPASLADKSVSKSVAISVSLDLEINYWWTL